MFRRILLGTSLALSLGACFNDQAKDDLSEEEFARWQKVAMALCLTPPPPTYNGFKEWLENRQILSDYEADQNFRRINGDPSCAEETLTRITPRDWALPPRSEPPWR
jgi:hypothetical protein